MKTPLLDDEKKDRICKVIETGGTREEAAERVGCHERTIRNTMARDPEFAERVAKAQLSLQERLRQRVLRFSKKGNWQATRWALERFFPDLYAPRKPDTASWQQVETLLANITGVIAQHVKNPEDRAAVKAALRSLLPASGELENED